MLRKRALPSLLVVLLSTSGACSGAGRSRDPETTLESFREAVARKRYEAAYRMMSRSYQRRVPFEEFERHLRDHPSSAEALVHALRAPSESVVEARVSLEDGDLVLVEEDGAFRIAGNPANVYDQSTPRAALRAFVRAFEHQRFDVILRFVPNAEREGMTEATIAEAWSGDQREQLERTVQNLRAHLDNPIEVVGDRATMPYGDRFTCQMIREDGVWRIESLE